MDPIALRPRKATEIIDAAIEVYRRNPIHFLLLAAIVKVPWLIAQIIYLAPREGDPDAIVTSMMIGVGETLTTFIMAGFVVHMASALYLGTETDAFDTMRKVAPRLPSVFTAALLQTIAILFALFVFIFPAVWVSAVLFAVMPAVVLERLNPFKAFDRSGQLSRNVKMHVLSGLGLVVMIRVLVWTGSVIVAAAIRMPELRYVVITAVSMVMYPLFGIATTLIYYDVRIRKEGFDIEMMAAQPQAVLATPA